MNDVLYFFEHILDASDWPPRWHCGKWSGFHGWLFIASDVLIWGAYFAIPIVIIKYLTYKKHQRFLKLYILFAAFILACGATHLLDAITFWVPLYRLSALMRAITATVSWLTVFYLIKLLPYAFSLKDPRLLEDEIEMREKAEAALRIKNQQLVEAEMIGKFGYFEWTIGRDDIICSAGMQNLLGISPNEQVIGFDDYISLIHPDDQETEKEKFANFIERKQFDDHYQRFITAGGQQKVFITRGVVIFDEFTRAEKLICTSQDVTEIKRNKQLLQESRQVFKNAFDYSAIGIALVSPEGRWNDVNQAICNLVGYTKEELLKLTFQDITHPYDLARDLAFVKQLLSKERETYQMEKRYFTKHGDIVWVLLSVSLVWQNEKPAFFISQMADITAQKKLTTEIEKKNLELLKANKELQGHIDHINEFNRIIAHNLRGPASSLISMANYLEENDNDQDKEFLLSKIKGTSSLILNSLNDLKEFLEIQINSENIAAPVSFKSSLKNAINLLDEQIRNTGALINFTFNVEEVVYPKIYLDSLFYNLLGNALKYTNKETTPKVNIETKYQGEFIVLILQDNGIGIDLQKHGGEIFKYKKIFHRGYESNGVGLFITKTQVEACDGKIEVESQVNEGTVFRIYFQKH